MKSSQQAAAVALTAAAVAFAPKAEAWQSVNLQGLAQQLTQQAVSGASTAIRSVTAPKPASAATETQPDQPLQVTTGVNTPTCQKFASAVSAAAKSSPTRANSLVNTPTGRACQIKLGQ